MPTYASFDYFPGYPSHLTPGKRYLATPDGTNKGFWFTDDDGDTLYCTWTASALLDGHDWIRHDEPDVTDEPLPLQIKEGGFYRRADGERVGPARHDPQDSHLPWNIPSIKGGQHWYRNDGTSCAGPEYDLVAEWTDEPEPAPDTPADAPARLSKHRFLHLSQTQNGGWVISQRGHDPAIENELLGAYTNTADMLAGLLKLTEPSDE